MEAHHTLRNVFSSDSDLSKSKIFPSAPTMVSPCLPANQLNLANANFS